MAEEEVSRPVKTLMPWQRIMKFDLSSFLPDLTASQPSSKEERGFSYDRWNILASAWLNRWDLSTQLGVCAELLWMLC